MSKHDGSWARPLSEEMSDYKSLMKTRWGRKKLRSLAFNRKEAKKMK